MATLDALSVHRTRRAFRALPCLLVLGAVLAVCPAAHAAAKWDPLPSDAMSVAKPQVDPDADAEVLLWTIRMEDELSGYSIRTVLSQYVRMKIFTAKGAQDGASVEIPHRHNVRIEELEARTVRPDGSTVELTKDQIFKRISTKVANAKVEVVAFAFPSVTPGCIVEYRWKEVRSGSDAGYASIEFGGVYATRATELYLKPLPLAGTGFDFKMRYFNMPAPRFEKAPGGFERTVLPPREGRRVEPDMPPRSQVDPWAIVYYAYAGGLTTDDLWKTYAKLLWALNEKRLAGDASVHDAAQSAVVGAETAADKADRIALWCGTSIEDVEDDRLGLSQADLAKIPENKTASDTLKHKRGTLLDIACLFVAMCKSVGLDARLAAVADRSVVIFDRGLGIPNLLDNFCASVSTDHGWRFYDPGIRWLSPGSLFWTNEGEEALLLDPKEPIFTNTPLAPPESTWCRRSATLRLDPEGNATGWITAEYAGHMGVTAHEEYDALSGEATVDQFKKSAPVHASEIQFDSVRVEGVLEPRSHVIERAAVKVPGYAQSVGDRLLVPLSFFEWKREPRFTDTKRRYPVYFAYPWATYDTVTIEIPEGYEVEGIPDLDPLVARGVGGYDGAARLSDDGRSVLFFRDLTFGKGEAIYFPADQYGGIKKLFDGFAERDEVTLVFRKKP